MKFTDAVISDRLPQGGRSIENFAIRRTHLDQPAAQREWDKDSLDRRAVIGWAAPEILDVAEELPGVEFESTVERGHRCLAHENPGRGGARERGDHRQGRRVKGDFPTQGPSFHVGSLMV